MVPKKSYESVTRLAHGIQVMKTSKTFMHKLFELLLEFAE